MEYPTEPPTDLPVDTFTEPIDTIEADTEEYPYSYPDPGETATHCSLSLQAMLECGVWGFCLSFDIQTGNVGLLCQHPAATQSFWLGVVHVCMCVFYRMVETIEVWFCISIDLPQIRGCTAAPYWSKIFSLVKFGVFAFRQDHYSLNSCL